MDNSPNSTSSQLTKFCHFIKPKSVDEKLSWMRLLGWYGLQNIIPRGLRFLSKKTSWSSLRKFADEIHPSWSENIWAIYGEHPTIHRRSYTRPLLLRARSNDQQNMYLCKFNNVFVQIIKCFCHALFKYLLQMLDTKGKYLLYLDKYVNIPLG